jgi:solute carrier family 45 protein 1/2/4
VDFHVCNLREVTDIHCSSQIGEAILAPGGAGGDALADDGASIRLGDTRLGQNGQESERARLFDASDEEESDDEDNDQNSDIVPNRPGLGSRRSTSNSPGRTLGGLGVLGNAGARQSSVNIADVNLSDTSIHTRDDEDPDGRPQGSDLAGKAGIILGIHNIFIVIPQFLVTALSAAIFALLEPDKSVLHGQHPGKTIPPVNGTLPGHDGLDPGAAAAEMVGREEGVEVSGPNSVAIIFRIGGAAAVVACVLAMRLARDLKRRT